MYRNCEKGIDVGHFWDLSNQSFRLVLITKLSPRIESCGHGSECLQRFLMWRLSELSGLLIFCKKNHEVSNMHNITVPGNGSFYCMV